ncbi:hypothetical protein [Acetatifactor muris]|uniref:hypothetical protein n=1 Tax=Acetatifactor muris TaxID=879566 RepID=UPI0023F102C9|nr:hypothetical protein [Acetatifactor muris]
MRKVKKVGQRFLGVLLTVLLSVEASGFISMAAETDVLENAMDEYHDVVVLEAVVVEDLELSSGSSPYTMLADCMISVGEESDGMHIDISTGTVGTASVLGVKDIKIWKKNWYGGWDLVATSKGGESYNRSTTGVMIVYPGAVKGATYKITCVHYGNVNGYTEGENDSGEFVYDFK